MTDFEERLRRAGEQLDAAAASAAPRPAALVRSQAARVLRPLAGAALGMAIIAGTLVWWSHQAPRPTSVVTTSPGTPLGPDQYVTVRMTIEGASPDDAIRLGLLGIRNWTLPASSVAQLPLTVDRQTSAEDRVTASQWLLLSGNVRLPAVGNVYEPCSSSHLTQTATVQLHRGPDGADPIVPLYIDLSRIQPGTIRLGTEIRVAHSDHSVGVMTQPVRIRLDISKAKQLPSGGPVTTATSPASGSGGAVPSTCIPSGPGATPAPCMAADLEIGGLQNLVEPPVSSWVVLIANKRGEPCSLAGRPGIELRSLGRWSTFDVLPSEKRVSKNEPEWTGVFEPIMLAEISVTAVGEQARDTPRYDAIRLTLPKGGGTLVFEGLDLWVPTSQVLVTAIEQGSAG